MLCLTCAEDLPQVGLSCASCGALLGDPTAHQGFLPQLKQLEDQMLKSVLELEQADVRLLRLEAALEAMVSTLARSTEALQLTLDDLQIASLDSILGPLRKSMQTLRDIVQELPVPGPWPEETWLLLSQTQAKIATGYRAFSLMTQLLQEKAGPA